MEKEPQHDVFERHAVVDVYPTFFVKVQTIPNKNRKAWRKKTHMHNNYTKTNITVTHKMILRVKLLATATHANNSQRNEWTNVNNHHTNDKYIQEMRYISTHRQIKSKARTFLWAVQTHRFSRTSYCFFFFFFFKRLSGVTAPSATPTLPSRWQTTPFSTTLRFFKFWTSKWPKPYWF